MEGLRKYFEKFIALTDEEWNAFSGKLQRKQLPARAFLLQQGEVCSFVAFVELGAFRFFYNRDGEERITAFFFAGDSVSNYRSFLTGMPSHHMIESLHDSVFWIIQKKDLHELFDTYPKLDRLGRYIAEKLYLTVARRLDSFLFDPPEKRYDDLLRRNSRLLQDVPQFMLASYLGIKPESLSRIRKRKTKKA
jgi:CRP/FNR family transcriptional regulator, anaerobic regulatory protein